MPAFRDYRSRIFDNYCDEIIRIFKLFPFSERVRKEILTALGGPANSVTKTSDLTKRLRAKIDSLILQSPEYKLYFEILLQHMIKYEQNQNN